MASDKDFVDRFNRALEVSQNIRNSGICDTPAELPSAPQSSGIDHRYNDPSPRTSLGSSAGISNSEGHDVAMALIFAAVVLGGFMLLLFSNGLRVRWFFIYDFDVFVRLLMPQGGAQ